ncbi:MAG: ABC transporter ATP-binding protein, partial [Deltaproteobacteria bacterium]
MSEPRDAALLRVRGLRARFDTDDGSVRAVDGLDFGIESGEIVGLVGESGCGKSATALALLGLLPKPQGRVDAGSVRLRGRELVGLPESKLAAVRGRRIAMIFQDPMTSLNPYLRVDEQLVEVAERHLSIRRRDARARATQLLARAGIPQPEERMRAYPHELSGGMRQRVMIAMALLCDPELLIADEPTTALDVTIQAQILELLTELRRERGMAILLITHDLGIVAGTADRVLVMYAGQLVEAAPTRALFAQPQHPYTQALLRCVPRLDGRPGEALARIDGLPPRLDRDFDACRFAPRCRHARDVCRVGEPALTDTGSGRSRRCA